MFFYSFNFFLGGGRWGYQTIHKIIHNDSMTDPMTNAMTDTMTVSITDPMIIPWLTIFCQLRTLESSFCTCVYNSRNLPLATAGEKVGRSRHQILQILPLLVDLCEGWAATWEGLIKIWNLQTCCQGRKGGDVGGLGAGKHQSIVQKSDAKDPLLRLLSVSASFSLSIWEHF